MYLPETGCPNCARFFFAGLGLQSIGFSAATDITTPALLGAPAGIQAEQAGNPSAWEVYKPVDDFLTTWGMNFRLIGPMQREIARLNFEGKLQAVAEEEGRTMAILPFGRIEKMVMLVTRPMVTVSEARLAAVIPADPARLTLSGIIGMRENKEVDANVEVVDMPIEQLMPEDLATLIHGRASGKLVWKRNRSGDSIVSDGELTFRRRYPRSLRLQAIGAAPRKSRLGKFRFPTTDLQVSPGKWSIQRGSCGEFRGQVFPHRHD